MNVSETMRNIRYLLEKYGNVEDNGAMPSIEVDRPRHYPITDDTRKHIVYLHRSGMPAKEIAAEVGRSITLVRTVIRSYAPRPARPSAQAGQRGSGRGQSKTRNNESRQSRKVSVARL